MEKILKYLVVALLGVSVALVFWAIFTTPSEPTINNAPAIAANLNWCYGLLGVAILVAILGASMDILCKPEGLKGAIFSIVAIVAIIVVSYVLAQGHDFQIVDLQNKGYFGRPETVITDASLIVTYVAMVGAIVAAVYSAVTDAMK